MEFLSDVIQTTLNSFDFSLVISINIVSYLFIKAYDKTGFCESSFAKRSVTVVCAIVLGVLYSALDWTDSKLALNSAILAPVFWSWIGKPLAKYFNVDYKSIELE